MVPVADALVGALAETVVAAGRIGESDCEALGDGLLVQPVNSLSSFAYVVVGVTIAAIARRRGSLDAVTGTYAVLLVLVGLGSVAFHGPQPAGSRAMHDLPILLTVILVAAHDVSTVFPGGPRRRTIFVPAALVATVVTIAAPDVGVALTGVAVVTVAVSEVVIYRRGLRPLDAPGQRGAAVAVIVTAGVAVASWLLGRTDGPGCDPQGVFQFHGLWHVLSAVVFGLWWWIALGSDRRRATADAVTRQPSGREV